MVLRVALRTRLVAPNAELGIARLRALAACEADDASWRDAVEQALRLGLLHDPVVLAEGGLQCHWRLALTPAGKALAEAGDHRDFPPR